jgi:hypothetical protein
VTIHRQGSPVFRSQYLVLAEQVEATARDGLNILGTFDGIRLAHLPARITFYLTTRLIAAEGTPGQHRYSYRFVWPSGEKRDGEDQDLPLAATPFGVATQRITIRLGDVPILQYGLHRVTHLRFTLQAFDTWEARAKTWAEMQARYGDLLRPLADDPATDPQLLTYHRDAYSDFAQRPPTVDLGFSKSNWEIGNKDEWYLGCHVPEDVFTPLRNDVLAGRCRRLDQWLQLVPMLVDDTHAPPSVSVTVGIPKMGRFSEGHSLGWVEQITWESSLARSSEAEASRTDPESELPTGGEQRLAALQGQIATLIRTVRWGIIALLAFFGLKALLS